MKIKSLIWAMILGGFIAILPLQVPAQTPMAGIPQFAPSGGWEVSATSLSKLRGIKGIKLPCMMMARYDNGFVMRLSGGGGALLAMAIDFRQAIFVQGRKYDAVIALDNGFTQSTRATAFSNEVLVFNLREFGGFYQAVGSAQSITVDVEGNPMRFSLGGVGEGLMRLESCFGGKPMMREAGMPTPPMPGEPMGTPMGQPPMGQPMGVPMENSPQVSKWEQTPEPAMTRMPRGPSDYASMHSVWEAKAGDDLQMTVQRWANKAGVNVAWQASNGGSVVDDIRVTGTFEEAVQSLMAQNAAAMGIEATMMGGGAPNKATPIMPSHSGYSSTANQPYVSRQDVSMSSMPTSIMPDQNAAPSPATGGRWNAPAGANLEQVLGTWAKNAGVEFIWQANEIFTVKAPVSANGSFESALQSLLGQYTNDVLRPAAQLNNDPVTGRRMLFVESSRVL